MIKKDEGRSLGILSEKPVAAAAVRRTAQWRQDERPLLLFLFDAALPRECRA